MSRTNALALTRTMNASQRMQHNVQLAKRAALFYLTTISNFMTRIGEEPECTSLGLSIVEVRELFGVWNAAWPTVLQLRNLAAQLEQRSASPKPSLDRAMLRGIAELCKTSARIADPCDAVSFLRTHHKALLDTLTNYAEDGQDWAEFRRRREQEMDTLANRAR